MLLVYYNLDIYLSSIQTNLVIYLGQAYYLITIIFDVKYLLIFYYRFVQFI